MSIGIVRIQRIHSLRVLLLAIISVFLDPYLENEKSCLVPAGTVRSTSTSYEMSRLEFATKIWIQYVVLYFIRY